MPILYGADGAPADEDITEYITKLFATDIFTKKIGSDHVYITLTEARDFAHSAPSIELATIQKESGIHKTDPHVQEIMKLYCQRYKIHLSVNPASIKEVADMLHQDIVENKEEYIKNMQTFKIVRKPYVQEPLFSTQVVEDAEVAFYPYSQTSAQWLYCRLKNIYKPAKTELSSGYRLLHNLGGPLVWWTGGDGDLKPRGIDWHEDFFNVFQEIPTNSGHFPLVHGQEPLKEEC